MPAGGTRVNHHSTIAGPGTETAAVELGPCITAGRSETMAELLDAAVARDRTTFR